MTIRVDPEGNETNALFSLVDLSGKKVLEIGSGDGRLTWLYAHKAGHVTGIEPYAPSVALANQHLPHALKHRIEFHQAGIEEYAVNAQAASFDVILLSWALC